MYKGSSPIIHPAENIENIDIFRKIKKSAPVFLAHFLSLIQSNVNDGIENIDLFKEMKDTIRINTSNSRWYVSYYSYSPAGKKVRKRIYGQINYEKDLNKRMELLLKLRDEIIKSIEIGVDYIEKQVFHTTNIYKQTDILIKDKQTYLKTNSIKSIIHHLTQWKKWLIVSHNDHKHPAEIKHNHIILYRQWLLNKNISNRTINNNIDEVRALFNYLIKKEEGLSFKNPCSKIDNLPSRSENHVSYTDEQFNSILNYLRENDKQLLLYVKLVAFAYLRTNEARNIQLKDIDMDRAIIILPAEKNKVNRRVSKLIQSIVKPDFEAIGIKKYNPNFYLFSVGGMPGIKPVGSNYFSKKFKKIKKKFNLSNLHTIYGFRHTSISQLIRNNVRWDKIMKLTGHTNMDSFQKYARSIMAIPAEDMSDLYMLK